MRAAVFVLAIVPVLAGCANNPQPREVGSLVGDQAPAVNVQAVDTQAPWRLSDQRGRVVLLDFMGVNCPPCRKQMPNLVAVSVDHATDERFAMLSVDMASVFPTLGAHDQDEIRAFKREFNATWPFAPDPGTVGRDFSLLGLPMTVVVDGNGVIRFKSTGNVLSAEEMERAISQAGRGT